MINEGYQPNKGKLDSSNPPKGGSGVPNKENIYKHMWESIKSAKINDKTIQKAIRILIKGIEEGYKNKPLPRIDPNLIQYKKW